MIAPPVQPFALSGEVASLTGLMAEIAGLAGLVSVGSRLLLHPRNGAPPVLAEVVGFRDRLARAMAFGPLDGLGPGARVEAPTRATPAGHIIAPPGTLAPTDAWLGRAIDPLGTPLDGRGRLAQGVPRPVRAAPPPAATRARLGPPVSLGVRAIDLFATTRRGQRLGLFAGSGIGKSTLLAMLARGAGTDVTVLALVGERGREVREFLEDELDPAARARAVTVIATADAPPLMRREAAHAAMTVAEYFRDRGRQVLLMMDSVTRFCLALREIGLSAGEPPATRGYPPSVFAELPRLLERAGPGPESDTAGHITGLFTVLVEGDDHNEPVADAVRGILDGHVVLDRAIAESGRYPAIDVARSLSRAASGCLTEARAAQVRRARALLATHADMADMVRLGAYRAGADPGVDAALALEPAIAAVLRQDRGETSGLDDAFAALERALDGHGT